MTAESKAAGIATLGAAEKKVEEFAEDLGRLLGQAQNKAESWLAQRKAIAAHLTELRDTAARLLAQLGVGEATPSVHTASVTKRTRGPAKAAVAPRKKRTMSAEARAKIGAAQRARWAKQRKEAT